MRRGLIISIVLCGVVWLWVVDSNGQTQSSGNADRNASGYVVRGVVQGRVSLDGISEMTAGKSNRLGMSVSGADVSRVAVKLIYREDTGALLPKFLGFVPSVVESDTHSHLDIVPPMVGACTMRLTVYFSDGMVENLSKAVRIQLPDSAVASFYVTLNGQSAERETGTVQLGLTTPSGSRLLMPMAKFDGSDTPVIVPPESVAFEVLAAPGAEDPISLDPRTGIVKAVRVGHALVIARFRSATSLVCVAVSANEDATDRTECEELTPAGMTLPEEQKKKPSVKVVRARPQQ